jgi:hypothetical protein
VRPFTIDVPQRTLENLAERLGRTLWPRDSQSGGAYAHVQRTRPETLAFALRDSPVGLAAWILDKWWAWSDCGGDLESRFSKDQLLSTVMLFLDDRDDRLLVSHLPRLGARRREPAGGVGGSRRGAAGRRATAAPRRAHRGAGRSDRP